jgi:hypothetical protein
MITAGILRGQAGARSRARSMPLPGYRCRSVTLSRKPLGDAGSALGDSACRRACWPISRVPARGAELPRMARLPQDFMLTRVVGRERAPDRSKFGSASSFRSAGLAFFGFVHAGELTAAGGFHAIGWASSTRWAIGYAACASFFALAVAGCQYAADRATRRALRLRAGAQRTRWRRFAGPRARTPAGARCAALRGSAARR